MQAKKNEMHAKIKNNIVSQKWLTALARGWAGITTTTITGIKNY